MTKIQRAFGFVSRGAPESSSLGKKRRRTRDCPRVTVRLSPEDHAKLTELADGMALSVYLRAKALGEELPRRRCSGATIEDRAAIAKLLGLLGQSRIANNLNQLAYHANTGTLAMDDDARAELNEAYELVVTMRKTLLQALGLKA